MAIDAMSPDRPATFAITRPVELISFGLCVAQAAYLVAVFLQGSWLIDALSSVRDVPRRVGSVA